jgi:DNA-binding LacI/PurR family transcriptional regulator
MNPKKEESAWVTAADVAALAGVSRSAVSRTFTEGASVSEETRTKVLAAAQALGYQVNMLARSMIQRQSNLVGVVVAGFDNPFLLSLLGPLTHELAKRSLAPLLMDASDPAKLVSTLRHLLQYRIAGAILTSGAPPVELAKEYLRLRIPLAMINREPGLQGVDVVNSDHRKGGAMAAELLRKGGARRLAFLSIPRATHAVKERAEGFTRALAADVRRGAVSVSKLVAADYGYRGGYEEARKLFEDAATRPDGVFCANDALACGVLDGARELHGLRVPQEVQIVGFDDIPLSGLGAYGLTTIRQDVNALAHEAVSCLCARMNHPDAEARAQTLPVTVVERATAGEGAARKPARARRAA